MSTLHILYAPEKKVHLDNRTDPFAIAIIKFVSNMTLLGWKCIFYGTNESSINCETVVCVNTMYIEPDKIIDVYNNTASIEIKKRKQSGDLILCFDGWRNQYIAEQNSDLHIVEPNIGYDHTAVFAPYRVFVSYATMHMFYGHHKMLMNPSWFDDVIPNAFTPEEFEFKSNKEDYILYFGRVVETKGVNVAIQATKEVGKKLIIAGPGSLSDLGYNEIPEHVQVVGVCDVLQRKTLMSNATAIIGPTYYVEPFGNMVVEGYFSGTPAITTDWGGFTETVINGVTGYRCREMREFIYALENIDKIDSHVCRKFAEKNYSEKIIHRKYDDYFQKIQKMNFYRK